MDTGCAGVRPGVRGVLRNQSTVMFFAAALVFTTFGTRLSAQNQNENNGFRAGDRPVELPDSTKELPEDHGAQAHSNHLILLRPERIQQATTGVPVGETPGSLACVYEISSASFSTGCSITGSLASGNNGLPNVNGGSKTIAIVDAYNYPTAYKDLSKFSTEFGLRVLPQCSASVTASCFAQVYASGNKPNTNGSWALEEALDIEWAHAMAPDARIVVVEAKSTSYTDLFTAVDVATNEIVCGAGSCPNGGSGSGEVSMSWGGSEFSTESSYDKHFQHTGVVYFAAAGDTGGATIYPSTSPYVVSAGGTMVNRNTSGDLISETTWNGGGGGPSAYEGRPSYQTAVQNLVGTKRGTPDFSFDANPNSGVFVYDSTPYYGSAGWWLVGGTSVASPSLAGIVNLAGSFQPSSAAELGNIYGTDCGAGPSTRCSTADFRDITSGTSGKYSAATGWDFTTGVGSNQTTGGK